MLQLFTTRSYIKIPNNSNAFHYFISTKMKTMTNYSVSKLNQIPDKGGKEREENIKK